MYLHTPALEVGSWWRVDTASGSDTATTVYAHDGTDAIPTALGTSGSTVRGNTRDGTAVFWSATVTLYLKELTYQGVPTGTVVTSTGNTPAAPGPAAPVDIATISTLVAALPTTYATAEKVTQAQQYRTTNNAAEANHTVSPAPFAALTGVGSNIVTVDPTQRFQQWWGVGAALTDAAAYCLMNYMTASARTALLTELFSPSQCGWNQVRIAFGSHSFSASPNYTYDDMPASQTDPALLNYVGVGLDTKYIIPLLQQILTINPNVQVHASVWSPPAWMKTTGSLGIPASRSAANPAVASDLDMTAVQYYANYLVKVVREYWLHGIPIASVSPLNEPFDPVGSITYVTDADYATLVATVGATFVANNVEVPITVCDHNTGSLANVLAVTSAATAKQYIGNIGWHAYGSPVWPNVSAARRAAPSYPHLVTEMRSLISQSWATSMGIFAGDLAVGSSRNWCSAIIAWNMVLDQVGNPFAWAVSPSPGSGRKGVVTVNNGTQALTRNAEYYLLRHLGQSVKPGATRIGSTTYGYGNGKGGIQTVAFQNRDSSIVLLVYNATGGTQTFQIADGRYQVAFPVTMAANEVSTFVWGTAAQAASTTPGAPSTITAPSAPTVVAAAGKGAIKLTITPPANGGAAITSYRIYASASSGQEANAYTITSGNTIYWDQIGSASTRYYTVTAINAAGESAASTEVSATAQTPTAPDAPAVTATAAYGATTLTFSTGHLNGSALTQYQVLRSTTTGTETALATVAVTPQGVNQTYVDTAVTPGTTYYYKVSATNATGTATSTEVTAASPALAAPTLNVVASAGTSSSANNSESISWSHTVGAGQHRLLVVAIAQSTATAAPGIVPSVTYNNVALTRLGQAWGSGTAGSGRAVDVFYMVNPPTGTATVLAGDPGSGVSLTWGGISADFSNVNPSAPLGTLVTAGQAATDVTSITATGNTDTAQDDILFAALTARTTVAPTLGGGQTSLASQVSATNMYTVASTKTAAGSTTASSFSWTTGDAAAEAVVAIHGG